MKLWRTLLVWAALAAAVSKVSGRQEATTLISLLSGQVSTSSTATSNINEEEDALKSRNSVNDACLPGSGVRQGIRRSCRQFFLCRNSRLVTRSCWADKVFDLSEGRCLDSSETTRGFCRHAASSSPEPSLMSTTTTSAALASSPTSTEDERNYVILTASDQVQWHMTTTQDPTPGDQEEVETPDTWSGELL